MSGIRDQENIDGLRKRLYKRGGEQGGLKRHELTDKKIDVARGWDIPKKGLNNDSTPKPKTPGDVSQASAPVQPPDHSVDTNPPATEEVEYHQPEEKKPKKRSFRGIIIIFSLIIFAISVVASSIYMFFGTNQISAKNINVVMEAPFTTAAGEEVTLQLSISNQNSVPIESPVLILNYPSGTKSADEENRNLYEERVPIEDVAPGEAINVPIKAILFGEENEEKEIRATIEYKVRNSNGTFFKEAEPVFVKISSSPLTLQVETINKISSGQEMDIVLTLKSNSQTPITDVLVSANYPNSFSYISSDPDPVSGQSVWSIDEILPEESKTIRLKGLITGLVSESSEIQFTAGNAGGSGEFIIDGVLAQAKTSYEIEEPFIDVDVTIGGDSDGLATLSPGTDANVQVSVTNTLDDTIYDMRVEMSPKGNLIRDDALSISGGFYDSSDKTINWEISSMSTLEEVLPGSSRSFSFSVVADPNQNTASFDVSVEVFARRVNEDGAKEELIGRAVAEAKYYSKIDITGQVSRDSGDQGPVPPVAGESTDYTVTLSANAGVNDIYDGVLTTSLPQYVTWKNDYTGPGNVEYNPVSKQLRWDVGDISAQDSKQLQIQLSLLPSVTHIGRTLTLINKQELRAIDRFTNTNLSGENSKIINELPEELGFEVDNGVVQRP